ncbi:efflux RND transporter permease subunit [Escherichia coli]
MCRRVCKREELAKSVKVQEDALPALRDVARVELGAEDYSTVARYNGKPAAGIAIKLATGANAWIPRGQ